jgi:hypothetical protein
MSLTEIFSIIIIHWIADFVMQDEKWALGKSKNWRDLIMHTMLYSMIWWFPALIAILLSQPDIKDLDELMFKSFLFVLVTFIFHTVTDYITSRIVSKRFTEETPFNIYLRYSMFKTGDILKSSSSQLDKTGQTYNGNNFDIILMSESGYHGGIEQFRAKRYNSIPNFGAFTLIGFDQVLHYIQLFGTYYLLVKI